MLTGVIVNYDIKLPVSEYFQTNDGIIFIGNSSNKDIKDALEQIALYFKNEFRYDNLQYCANDMNENCIGFLFADRALDLVEHMDHHPYRVIGGGCFIKLGGNKYRLDWIWLHPFARNMRKLKQHWPIFIERFGAFTLTKPILSLSKITQQMPPKM